jgi:ketosteroid isomerase-like protein
MADEAREVLAANAAFYDAFTRRDAAAMDSLWARTAPVACVHPGWELLAGRDAVMMSWRRILVGGTAPDSIRCERPQAFVSGNLAYVLCFEVFADGAFIATNAFVREGGRWLMSHHHASPLPSRSAADPDRLPN